tara:strand:+ start:3447 stop:3707 length:261 start_codon:yes stop_codon:yes gene_type:complete
MSRYYCPFCSSQYQIHKTRSNGVFICSQCGDPLIKQTLISSRQIIGLIAASAFLTPLLLMTFFVFESFMKEKTLNISEPPLPLTVK